MATLVWITLILCAFAGYSSAQEHFPALLGESCKRDIDCIEHAFCRWQQTCLCDPYYSPTLDKSMCIATVGLTCHNNSMCATMTNAECKQNTCACKDDYFLDSTNSSNCIGRPVEIGDLCQVNSVCQDSFDSALCIDNQCQCFTGHHFVNHTKTCIQSRGLYYSCKEDYECYMDDRSSDALECKNRQCLCKEGEPQCAGGSLVTATGALMTISLLLQRVAQ
ncbi:hypothetical protein DMN91_002050 [Ooceraea biroi]|uniref:EB domain-containing protein n=1 Tax=Ooceraea biroi TaxID=2015173 RepID=A0A026WE84_OOCBI|nr:protein slit [Ooceraea biroi]EZA54377.1 hypothetical protein X777_05607 [Ooceraea biroi]RLU25889.1 hypothetical protein DMN91_002050 [Ooceraea biroi]